MSKPLAVPVTESLPTDSVLRWFAEYGRDLPWRQSRDPYEILVAELMLQQTQVSRVLERWPQFLRRFPEVVGCASAPVGDVIDEWSGLGYNRRAVFLHAAASIVVQRHEGTMPTSLSDLLALPGVGPYTARAVMAFAYEADEGVVDTNVGRILARWTGARLSAPLAQRIATSSVPAGFGWAWNQALLDIGAGLCRAREPDCGNCPLAPTCAWRGRGDDPAVGSARVSAKQAAFSGSNREGRAKVVRALRDGPVAIVNIDQTAGWPGEGERVAQMVQSLVRDGLVERHGDKIGLAGWSGAMPHRPESTT